jgi:hypothetical protein
MKPQRLPLNRITIHDRRIAGGCNILVIASLTHMYRSSSEDAPPIRVRRKGKHYVIVDGRHRFIASVISGRHDVLAEVEP